MHARSYQPGTIIRDRYMVEEILGSGGFSVVYLVRDLTRTTTAETAKEALFALKELTNHEPYERVLVAFEGDVLKRLQHPSLPRIYDVQEASSDTSAFLVLEYIEGANLETLRRQQAQQRFSLDEAIRLMEPVIDAIRYLHQQQPPVLHRDIKPANIMVQKKDQYTFLIDFGIAKEYEVDATTTAVRHCTPGYSAPEQYSKIGTDVRTDIYALGATFYCLLTGIVPVDSLVRTTMLVSSQCDPIQAAHEIVPEIPWHISRAIERAMAIGYQQRFDNIDDFWKAMQPAENTPMATPLFVLNSRDQSAPARSSRAAKTIYAWKPWWQKGLVAATSLSLLLLLTTSGKGYAPPGPIEAKGMIQQSAKTMRPSVTPTEISTVPLAKAYQGTIYNFSTKSTVNIQLTDIKQNQQSFSGYFTSKQEKHSMSGVLDRSQHLLFTVTQNDQQTLLFFEGAVRSDGYLVGNYCTQNQAGQCLSSYGLWSLEPIKKS